MVQQPIWQGVGWELNSSCGRMVNKIIIQRRTSFHSDHTHALLLTGVISDIWRLLPPRRWAEKGMRNAGNGLLQAWPTRQARSVSCRGGNTPEGHWHGEKKDDDQQTNEQTNGHNPILFAF